MIRDSADNHSVTVCPIIISLRNTIVLNGVKLYTTASVDYKTTVDRSEITTCHAITTVEC